MNSRITSRRLGAFALLAALTALPARAEAAGLALDGAALPAPARTALRAEIDAASKQVPALFGQAYAIAQSANALDEASRLRGAPLTLAFKALGPRALHPMLEMLVFDGHAPRDLTPSAERALRLGLLEAVGIVRDARAVPVLSAVLDRSRDEATTRAAAEGLGRIGTDEAFAVVAGALGKARAAHDAERERVLFEGVGAFKRTAAAKLLAAKLAAHPDEATARVLARALGSVGNAWAWQALADRAEEADARDAAARALALALPAYRAEARGAIEKALLVVVAPGTKGHLAEARKGASADGVAVIDALEARLAKNPTR